MNASIIKQIVQTSIYFSVIDARAILVKIIDDICVKFSVRNHVYWEMRMGLNFQRFNDMENYLFSKAIKHDFVEKPKKNIVKVPIANSINDKIQRLVWYEVFYHLSTTGLGGLDNLIADTGHAPLGNATRVMRRMIKAKFLSHDFDEPKTNSLL